MKIKSTKALDEIRRADNDAYTLLFKSRISPTGATGIGDGRAFFPNKHFRVSRYIPCQIIAIIEGYINIL